MGTWDAALRGRAILTLTSLVPIGNSEREEVEREGARLLAWLRPDAEQRNVRWVSA